MYGAEHALPINEGSAREYLSAHAWPKGLQDTIINSFNLFPIRYFVVDDSGSMNTNDGHRLIKTASGVK